MRKGDLPSGSGDDSFTGGAKEGSDVPAVSDGSIPPNKSDLKTFGVYQEENDNGRFLHLFWTRVQDPSGTTNMDFEFNQSQTLSANGVTTVRTAGDLLIVYELSKGGTVPLLFVFTWLDGTEGIACESANSYPCWGDRTDLSASRDAEGSINQSAILEADSDGLGAMDPRTFGEASIDLEVIFDDQKCSSFGSVYLKSRSSDSFTAAMKDFIAPQDVNISNCGTVIIHKETDPAGGTGFEFISTAEQEAGPYGSFYLDDDGQEDITNVLAGTGYTVSEDSVPAGWDLTNIDCGTAGVEFGPAAGPFHAGPFVDGDDAVKFNIAVGDTVECWFTNTARGNIIIRKKTLGGPDTFGFSSSTLSPSSFDLTTTTEGAWVSKTFSNLVPGSFDVSEDSATGWSLADPTCSDGSDPSSIGLSAGETVTCDFENTKLFTIIVLVCQQTDNTLYPSEVALDGGDPVASLGSVSVPGDWPDGIDGDMLMQFLCGLGGARFEDLTADDLVPYDISVIIGSLPYTPL